jgi:hypothetical protein
MICLKLTHVLDIPSFDIYQRILKITETNGPSGTLCLNPLFYYLHFFLRNSLHDLQ